jgi:hypothetical protein
MKTGLLMVSALLLVGGCEKANKGSLADDIPVGKVRLIGAGVDPKVQLRYHVDKGTHTAVDMTMKMTMETSAAQLPAVPVIKMTMDETCTDVEANGDMRFEVKVVSIDVDGPAADMMKDAMGGMVMRFRTSPTGKVSETEVTGLTGPMAQLGEQMKSTVEQFAAPLPEEAVGKGSTWKFKKTAKANGIEVSTIANFTLVDFKDDVATVKVDGRMSAPPQTVQMAKLEKMDGTVTGTIANDLRRMAPTGTFGADINMKLSAMGQNMTMRMTVDAEMTSH